MINSPQNQYGGNIHHELTTVRTSTPHHNIVPATNTNADTVDLKIAMQVIYDTRTPNP
jgi:hypothetical protein